MNVLFVGMTGQLSTVPLKLLLSAEIVPRAVLVPATTTHAGSIDTPVQRLDPPAFRSELPLVTRFSDAGVVHLAWECDVPVYAIQNLNAAETHRQIASFEPDVVCVSCFDRRIPSSLLNLPSHGWLNVHPSLLPAYRGPAPLFWAVRNGEPSTGVTVHRMDAGMDTGDVLLQRTVPIAEGVYGHELEARCASIGGELLIEALRRLEAGTLTPQRQAKEDASTYPAPTADDFVVPVEWSARHAFTFIRGVSHWGYPPEIHTAGRRFHVRDAITYNAEQELGHPFVHEHDVAWVQFSPGTLQVALTHET